MNTIDKEKLFAALDAFIRQRPGFEYANYMGAPEAYRADSREATRQLQDARALARVARWDAHPDALQYAFVDAARRLTWNGERLDYTTCQYRPLEYRAAVARALASALWHSWRDRMGAAATGDDIRRKARDVFGRGLARRWFS
jgi:16S rRNA C967 or C1407 C5-methylase (RsmB/RsmF family)